ncbi:Uma2 family endonuclease [Virgibacillus kimchii]
MNTPEEQNKTFEEYQRLREETAQRLEYINGTVFMSAPPNTIHQRISMKLSAILYRILENKDCEVIAAPYDIELSDDRQDEKNIVIPDLSVICDKNSFTANRYVGPPEIIIEILSPSNQSHDLIYKTNLYQTFGVKEYWIINPMLSNIMVYTMGDNQHYRLAENEKQGIVKSKVIEGFEVDVEEIFKS